MARETAAEILNKLDINPETDCVCAFKPERGCSFYIPDGFKERIIANQPVDVQVKLMFTVVQMMQDASDPVVQDFAALMWDRVLADLAEET